MRATPVTSKLNRELNLLLAKYAIMPPATSRPKPKPVKLPKITHGQNGYQSINGMRGSLAPHIPIDRVGNLAVLLHGLPIHTREGRTSATIRRMRDGDSVLLPSCGAAESMTNIARMMGVLCCRRVIDPDKGTYRVWRIGMR